MPYERQKVYSLNKESFYSLNAASSICGISQSTLRRRVSDNKVYHVLLNNKVKFLDWQALVNGAIENGLESISIDRVHYKMHGDFGEMRSWQDFTDHKERNEFLQRQLDRWKHIEVEQIKKSVKEIVKENTHHGRYKLEIPSPGLTHEYIVSQYCWAKYELSVKDLFFCEYENTSALFHKNFSHKKFNSIKDNLLQNEHTWTIQDLRKAIDTEIGESLYS